MHVNAAKYLWILLCALGFKLDGDILDRLAALLKDMNYIVSRTATQADQHQLHGTWSRSASLRPESRSKHDPMPAPGLADERSVFNPFDACLHPKHPQSPIADHSAPKQGMHSRLVPNTSNKRPAPLGRLFWKTSANP